MVSCVWLNWALHKGGIYEGSIFQVPGPARCVAKRAAKGWELLLPLAKILNWMSCESVFSQRSVLMHRAH